MANMMSAKSGVAVAALLMLTACNGLGDFDMDMRGNGNDRFQPTGGLTSPAPQPDARGVLTYPDYQVAVARPGDTVGTIAARLGVSADELARINALPQNVALRSGAVVILPQGAVTPGIAPAGPGGTVDVATIAGSAIERAENGSATQPIRHTVQPGETAFSIARTYGVPVSALAEWNGLGSDLALRDGQTLLIPTRSEPVEVATIAPVPVARPGAGSATPVPPSASAPLPAVDETPVAAAPTPAPAPQPTASTQSAASDTSRLRMPVQGPIIRAFEKGRNEGIGISAPAGTAVVAADAGTVAAITRDTDQVPILVIRHENNILTVYAGVANVGVEKGDSVRRGQKIAEVREGSPSFLHFEVREGFESVDPEPYLR